MIHTLYSIPTSWIQQLKRFVYFSPSYTKNVQKNVLYIHSTTWNLLVVRVNYVKLHVLQENYMNFHVVLLYGNFGL